MLLGRETEGQGGAEGQGGVFAELVVAGRVAALHRAVLHRFQHLQAGHEFTGGEGLDEKATSAHLAHPAADRFRPAKDRVQGVGPAGGQCSGSEQSPTLRGEVGHGHGQRGRECRDGCVTSP